MSSTRFGWQCEPNTEAELPLAIGFGAGAELQQPMAVVLVGGVVTSTLLTLVILPAFYRLTIGSRG